MLFCNDFIIFDEYFRTVTLNSPLSSSRSKRSGNNLQAVQIALVELQQKLSRGQARMNPARSEPRRPLRKPSLLQRPQQAQMKTKRTKQSEKRRLTKSSRLFRAFPKVKNHEATKESTEVRFTHPTPTKQSQKFYFQPFRRSNVIFHVDS